MFTGVLWVINLIEQVVEETFIRKRDVFVVYRLDTFYPHGLNQREINAA